MSERACCTAVAAIVLGRGAVDGGVVEVKVVVGMVVERAWWSWRCGGGAVVRVAT
jgi:hypothetical protein